MAYTGRLRLKWVRDIQVGKIAQQNVFESILKRKQVFPDYKNNKLKKWIKIGIFPKGLVHGFGERFFSI